MQMEKGLTWTVVQFLNDGSVEAVPSTWIKGDICHWPSFRSSKMVTDALRKCEPLNTCWSTHAIKIFRNAIFDDYMTARNKAKLAEDTSDLNTCDETGQKRKRVQKRISSSESSSDSELDHLPLPPKLKSKQGTTASQQTSNKLEKEREMKEIERANTENILADIPSTPNAQSCHGGKDQGTTASQQTSNKLEKEREMKEIERVNTENILADIPSTPNARSCHGGKDQEKNMKILIQQNHVLRSLMMDTLAEVKDIKTMLQPIVASMESSEIQKADNSFFKLEGINFPINSDEELDHLENLLQNLEVFQKGATELSKLGGSSTYDLIKRIFSLTLDNNQTIKYSWLGRKGKRPFHNLNLSKLIMKAVENSGLATTQKDIEVALQTWIRRASDRRTLILKKFK